MLETQRISLQCFACPFQMTTYLFVGTNPAHCSMNRKVKVSIPDQGLGDAHLTTTLPTLFVLSRNASNACCNAAASNRTVAVTTG
jgi:hypothetical protein